MATVTLRNVPESLYEKLKNRAEQTRRSMNAEAIVCLEKALESEQIDPEQLLADAENIRSLSNDELYVTDEQLRAARQQGRE